MERPGHWRLCPLREWGPLSERRLGSDGREVAVFHFLPDAPPALRELVTLSRTAPRAWLKLWGMTRIEGRDALAMEAAPGVDARRLCQRLRERGAALPNFVAVDIVRAVTEAYFDHPGAQHLPPERLQLTWHGETRLALDLVAAGATWGQFARRGRVEDLGTIPPEIIRHGFSAADARTAVYSAGMLLLMLLSREFPYRAENEAGLLQQVMKGRLQEPDPFIDRLGAGLKTVLQLALAVDPDQRLDTPSQLRERLSPFGGREGETKGWLAQNLPRLAPWEFSRQQLSLDVLAGRDPEPMPPELEARLLDRPDDEDGWAVLADHLMASGSPRGELAEVQRRLETALDVTALKAHERRLLEADARLEPPRALRCAFHRGYVRVVEVGPDADLAALEEAMAHPSLRFLHTLRVTQLRLAEPALSVLVAAKHRAVRRLELPVGLLVDEPALRRALPRLEAIVSHSV